MDPSEIKKLIENGMDTQHVKVSGDGTHFEAIIVSKEFSGKGLVQRHQMVYRTLGNSIKGDIHALSMKTYTPEQWTNMS